ENPLADGRRAEPLALEREEDELLRRVEPAELDRELEAIDDLRVLAEEDVLRPQVAVRVAGPAADDPAGEHRGALGEKPRLGALDALDAPDERPVEAELRRGEAGRVLGGAFPEQLAVLLAAERRIGRTGVEARKLGHERLELRIGDAPAHR